MLLDFSIANFRSFHQIQKLDLRAANLVSENKNVDLQNIVNINGNRVLKTVGLYGPNGSGKSNLLKGLKLFRELVQKSLESEVVMTFAAQPFKLSSETMEHAGFFQVQILLEENKYRYGFTLDDKGGVSQEWLFGPAEKKETWYFRRTGNDVENNKEWFDEGNSLPTDNLRHNTLFLTFVSAYNGALSQMLRGTIVNSISFDDSNSRPGMLRRSGTITRSQSTLTNNLLKEGKGELVLEWLRNAGLFYSGIQLEEVSDRFSEYIILEKSVLDSGGNEISKAYMDLRNDESSGTQKFYSLIGRLHKKFIEGGLIVIDEIDNNFHPSLLQRIIGFFNNPTLNAAGAQLIFTSHDTNLLDPAILRRDQIYFTEKSIYDESILYSLADLKGIRNNSDFARQYLAGFYGALPVLDNFKNPPIK